MAWTGCFSKNKGFNKILFKIKILQLFQHTNSRKLTSKTPLILISYRTCLWVNRLNLKHNRGSGRTFGTTKVRRDPPLRFVLSEEKVDVTFDGNLGFTVTVKSNKWKNSERTSFGLSKGLLGFLGIDRLLVLTLFDVPRDPWFSPGGASEAARMKQVKRGLVPRRMVTEVIADPKIEKLRRPLLFTRDYRHFDPFLGFVSVEGRHIDIVPTKTSHHLYVLQPLSSL